MSQTLLRIDSSVRTADSVSRALTDQIINDLEPSQVITRDLAADPLPQITGDWAAARLVPEEERTEVQRALLALSDSLIEELQTADTIVIGAPIYNFGPPASLKAWIDLVARPKVTFAYTADGPIGLLKNKTAYLAMVSGGVPIGSPADFATHYLKHMLGFLGVSDVTVMEKEKDAAAA